MFIRGGRDYMFKVSVTNKHFNGIRAGVQFENGEAVTSDKKVAKELESYGYSVVEEKPKAQKKAPVKKAPKKEEE
jgi:hypothetical protein